MNNESIIRFGFFFVIVVLMMLWEVLAPRRSLSVSRPMRWFSNLSAFFEKQLVHK